MKIGERNGPSLPVRMAGMVDNHSMRLIAQLQSNAEIGRPAPPPKIAN
jgi:hypothetical protein